MILRPGCRFVVAPRFHLPPDWQRRFDIGIGLEEMGGRFFPRNCWRPPTTDELDLLLPPSTEPMSDEELDASICLFQLPTHLQTAWWMLLEQGAEVLGDAPLAGF